MLKQILLALIVVTLGVHTNSNLSEKTSPFAIDELKPISEIVSPLSEKCSGLVNLRQSLYKDNIKVQNTIKGSLQQNQNKIDTFLLASQYDLTSCPIDKPFSSPDHLSCFNCPSGDYFNLGTRKCQSCPNPQEAFSITSKKCEKVICKETQIFNPKLRKCQECPDQTPVFNKQTKKCDSCPNNQVYDFNSRSCLTSKCLQNQFYDGKTSKCTQCPSAFPQVNLKTNKCQACPKGQGFYTVLKKCSVCSLPIPYLNPKSGNCETCPINSVWISAQKICGYITCPSNFPYFNKITSKCQGCPDGYIYDKDMDICRIKNTINICPASKPIYYPTSKQCKACPQQSLYNKQEGTCLFSCAEGYKFNWDIEKCQSICNDPLKYWNGSCRTPEYIKGCSSDDQMFSVAKNQCINIADTCDEDTQYYNTVKKQCLIVPPCPLNYRFNHTSMSCQIIDYITSPKSPNLIYNDKPFKEYQDYYESRKKSDLRLEQCPQQYPYYSKKLRNCVSCPESSPYFNLYTSQCQDCGKFQYDKAKRSCHTEEVNISPTLQRLIMNII